MLTGTVVAGVGHCDDGNTGVKGMKGCVVMRAVEEKCVDGAKCSRRTTSRGFSHSGDRCSLRDAFGLMGEYGA